MNTQDFVDAIDALRKANKDQWYEWAGTVNSTPVKIKGYNTWIQILQTPNWTDSGPMDCSVKAFKAYLAGAL